MSKNQFRRGQRVIVRRTKYFPGGNSEVWRYGAVTNPSVRLNQWQATNEYVRVRMDSQQPWETGYEVLETDVKPAPDATTEYQLRHYELRHMSHTDVAAIRLALENVNLRDDVLTDETVQRLLHNLPELP